MTTTARRTYSSIWTFPDETKYIHRTIVRTHVDRRVLQTILQRKIQHIAIFSSQDVQTIAVVRDV